MIVYASIFENGSDEDVDEEEVWEDNDSENDER